MNLIVLLAASSVGVDYGWQPNQDGEVENINQIEPVLLESLRAGTEITSRIDPRVQGVRRFRIRVGNGTPPRVGSTTAPADVGDSANDKVANDVFNAAERNSAARGASIPSNNVDVGREQPPTANLQPPPLITPDRLKANGGGSFSLEPGGQSFPRTSPATNNDFPRESYLPLKEAPIDSGETGPSPIPDPDRASRHSEASSDAVQLTAQPRKLEPSPGSEPLTGQQASYNKVVAEPSASEIASPSDINFPAEADPNRPWKTLVLICLLLFASVGLNVYLGWIARGIYARYRSLSLETRDNQAATA